MGTSRCTRCRNYMTWATARAQWGRALRRGVGEDQWGKVAPLCPKCATAYLKESGAPPDPKPRRKPWSPEPKRGRYVSR